MGGITLVKDEPDGPGPDGTTPDGTAATVELPAAPPPPPPPTGPAPGPDAAEISPRKVRMVFLGLMLTLLLAALDQMIVATALPKIVGELHGLEKMSWAVTAYLLASTIVLPLYGKLGDLFGRKGVFQFAIVVFIIGSALAGWSRTMDELIAFRAVQGIGGGGLMIGVQAIIADIVPPRERGRYMGLIGAVFGLASVAGPCSAGSSPTTPPGAGASTSTSPSAWSPWPSSPSSSNCPGPPSGPGSTSWARCFWPLPPPVWCWSPVGAAPSTPGARPPSSGSRRARSSRRCSSSPPNTGPQNRSFRCGCSATPSSTSPAWSARSSASRSSGPPATSPPTSRWSTGPAPPSRGC